MAVKIKIGGPTGQRITLKLLGVDSDSLSDEQVSQWQKVADYECFSRHVQRFKRGDVVWAGDLSIRPELHDLIGGQKPSMNTSIYRCHLRAEGLTEANLDRWELAIPITFFEYPANSGQVHVQVELLKKLG